MSGERGAALVMTLLFSAAMAAAAVAFIDGRRQDGLALRAQIERIEAEAALDAALVQTAALLANRRDRQPVPEAMRFAFDRAAVAVRIESESGKVDLNAAEEPMLQALMLALGRPQREAERFADTVLDWRDDNELRRVNGAEAGDYANADRGASAAADRPLAHPAELRYVLAVDEAAWRLLAPLVTIYTGEAQPNGRRSPPAVRRALAIAKGLAPAGSGRPEPGGASMTAAAEAAGRNALAAGRATAPRLAAETPPAGEGNEAAEDARGIFTLNLDLRLPSGYQAAARTVVRLAADATDQPFSVLDWTPFVAVPEDEP